MPIEPAGVSFEAIAEQMEVGRLFGDQERRTRRVLDTSIFDPSRYIFRSRVPESEAFAARVELLGSIRPGRVTYLDGGKAAIVEPADADFKVYGGRTYYETPNSTSVAIGDREFVITRGIRPYKNRIQPGAGVFNKPEGYVSDLLLFERGADGKLEFVHRLLDSKPEKGFLFEDPRISIVGDRIFLSGTVVKRHVPGDRNMYIRNGVVELSLIDGVPQPVKPKFAWLSPAPALGAEGPVDFDAKNAVIAQRDDGKIVVRTRFRPNFEREPVVQKYREKYGDRVPSWAYGVQTFVFDDLEHLARYDWKNALDLVLASALGVEPISRRKNDPVSAKLVMTERSLQDFYDASLYVKNKPLGFGPGTRPLRLERQGDRLLVSDGPGAKQFDAGRIGDVIADGEVLYLSFDHKLRYLSEPETGAMKRVYSGAITLWEKDLETPRLLYDDVVQPIRPHQVGLSGILDLHHAAYNMGVMLLPRGEEGVTVRVTAGEADAHTVSYDWDLAKIIGEMASPERRASGQVYQPNP
jgi:hypothetical protein